MSIHDDLKIWHQIRDYDKICLFYDQVKNVETIQPSEWDFVFIMNGLYKKNRYAECLSLYKVCHRIFPECTKLNDKMGWCVYHFYIKNFDSENGNSEDFFRKVDYVLANVSDGQYSPVSLIVKFAVKTIFHKQTIGENSYVRANKYLNYVHPENLSRDEKTFNVDGRNYSVASDYEWWFSTKSKCLLNLQAYDDCIKICDEGLNTITNFHSNNDSWFKYRKATCFFKIGLNADAKKVAADIIKNNFNHWCIYDLLYDISVAEKNVSDALKYAGGCSLADRSHEMRVTFYAKFAQFLNAQGMTEQAMLHARLYQLIRQENNWRSKDNFSFNIDAAILNLNKNEILRRLNPFWEKNRDRDKVFLSGVVSRLLTSGRDGFVKMNDTGEEYYFNFRDVKCNPKRLSVGTKVKFVLGKRLDKKHNIIRKNAVELKLA